MILTSRRCEFGVQRKPGILMPVRSLNRADVRRALLAAGRDKASSDDDIRRIVSLHIEMIRLRLQRVEDCGSTDVETVRVLVRYAIDRQTE